MKGLTTERRVCQVRSSGTNNAVSSTYALVRDSTSGDGCAPGSPGADIAFVVLEDRAGDVVAWGRTVKDGVQMQDNDFSNRAFLDGAPPAGGADSCPPFEQDHVVALGCGGYLAVDFVDADHNPVAARSGEHKLRVGEFGEQCEGGDDLDRYEVLLCPQIENTAELPDGCAVSIGLGQGERAFEF